MIKIALADDHVLLRNGLAGLLTSLGYKVLFEADNGQDFIDKISAKALPQLVLMDINMPVMDGFQTTKWLRLNHPSVRVLALSMYDNEGSIIRMLKCGARGYLLKDIEPEELQKAITSVIDYNYYYSGLVNSKLIHSLNQIDDEGSELKLLIEISERERTFMKLACTELTYREIAEQMGTSPRTIDTYRDGLFIKLHIKTRVGLVMYAIRNKLVGLE